MKKIEKNEKKRGESSTKTKKVHRGWGWPCAGKVPHEYTGGELVRGGR